MPSGASWTTPEGGFFVWLTLPEGASVARLLPTAREQNVEFLPGAATYHHGEGDNQLRLSYSFADEEQIAKGIEILGNLVKAQG
jgi:DNA-binding transcriptional MocR family regulator